MKKAAKIVHGNALRIDWRSLTTPNPSLKGGEQEHLAYKAISNLSNKKEFRRELRNNATPAEVKLWQALSSKKLEGFKFRRQHSIGRYILDFFCPSANLAIELDGSQHFSPEGQEYNQQRDDFLRSVGITVVRYPNNFVFENLEAVLDDIRSYLTTPELPFESFTSLSSSFEGGKLEGQGGHQFDFILGNPPFVGSKMMTESQRQDLLSVFNEAKGAGVMDYVSAWYVKAAQYLSGASQLR